MKTKYLIFTVLLSFILTIGVDYLVSLWNTKSFEKSDLYEKYLDQKRSFEIRYLSGSSIHSADEIKSESRNLVSHYKSLFRLWKMENEVIYRLRLSLTILLFFVFNFSLLNYKYAEDYSTPKMIKSACKNPFYSMLSVIILILLIINVIKF
jgi:hypothetical protein